MAFTKDDLDQLDEAIASGELSVKIDGRDITYRSIGDLQRARRMVVRALLSQSGRSKHALSGITTRVDRGV